MRKALVALSFVALLAGASDAFAFGGGGGRGGGVASGGGGASSAAVTTPQVRASEPIAALLVGLGLVGARLLRRR